MKTLNKMIMIAVLGASFNALADADQSKQVQDLQKQVAELKAQVDLQKRQPLDNPNEHPYGYFTGNKRDDDNNSRDAVQIFAKHITTVGVDGRDIEASYGMIIDTDRQAAAVYEVEGAKGNRQLWNRLEKTSDGILGTDLNHDASYLVEFDPRQSSGKFIMTPTSYGISKGCNQIIEATRAGGRAWGPMPEHGFDYAGDHNAVGRISDSELNGTFTLGDRSRVRGEFSFENLTPDGAVTYLHPNDADSMSADGISFDENYAAIAAAIYHGPALIDGNYDEMDLISPDSDNCEAAYTTIHEDKHPFLGIF